MSKLNRNTENQEHASHLPEHGPIDENGKEVLLSLKNVDITFGKGDNAVRAVKNATFDIHKGETFSLVGESGSGKTTLLEETIRRLKAKRPIYVIEGDQQTSNDADRIAALEIPVFQVNTGTGCHLEADMVNHAVKHLNPKEGAILFIENVGNLVCPAMFDLGESKKVVIVSTTEGDDKPLKYPHIFQEADICVINKIDLAPYLNTKVEVLRENALKVNHHLQIFEVSATKGDGMDAWCDWLQTESAKCK